MLCRNRPCLLNSTVTAKSEVQPAAQQAVAAQHGCPKVRYVCEELFQDHLG